MFHIRGERMIIKTPTKFFLVSGIGEGNTPLTAFDKALLNAGVANTNLLKVTSIPPPSCKEVRPFRLPFGAIVPVVYALKISSTKDELITATVGMGIPQDGKKPGLIMEYSCIGGRKESERILCEMVEEGFANRKEKLKKIKLASAECRVKRTGAACAVVVLWD